MMPGAKMLRRASWGLGDQALSSLTNFALGAVVARSVSPESFGAFTLAFATYLLVLGLSRAVSSEPFVIRFSAVSDREWARGVASSTGTSILVGIVGGIGCAIAGILTTGNVRGSFLALALTLPGLMLQDNWRNVFFARRGGAQAFVKDLVWAVVLFPLTVHPPVLIDRRDRFPLRSTTGLDGEQPVTRISSLIELPSVLGLT
jgi:O-antigen/teichoic acid export membrane protein